MASVGLGGGGNYVTDGEIMEWLALEQDRIYGDLRDSMDLSRGRASFSDELNKLKTELHDANSASPSDFSKVDAHVKELLTTYGSDPEYAELCDGLESISNTLGARVQEESNYANALDNHNATLMAAREGLSKLHPTNTVEASTYSTLLAFVEKTEKSPPTPPADHPYTDDQLQSWDGLIGGKLDLVNKNDQLNMIHIQQLKALGDQSSQLGSQFIASSDKTSSSIINNIA
jgi:hypothetical protein